MNLIGLYFFEVDPLIIVLAYLTAYYGETRAGIFAFSQGLVIDIFSTGLLGLFTFLYLMVLLSIFLGSRLFDLNFQRGQFLVISSAALVKQIVFFSLVKAFSFDITVSASVLLSFIASALCVGLVGPILFYVLNCVNNIFIGGIRKIPKQQI